MSKRRKKLRTFLTFPTSEVFLANFYVGCLEAEMMQKNFRPKTLRTFFHEATKTPREVFGSHHGESLSLLLIEVAMTPSLPSQQAITCAAMPSGGSAATTFSLAARQRRQAWQRNGGVRLGSTAAVRRHQGMAAPAATNAVLPPHVAAVAIKTPTATAMARAQTINNQLKALKQQR